MLCLFNKMMTIVDKYKEDMKDMDYLDMCNYLKIMKSISDKKEKYVCHYYSPEFKYCSSSNSIRVSYQYKKKVVLCELSFLPQLLDGSRRCFRMGFNVYGNGDTELIDDSPYIYKRFECGDDTDDEEDSHHIQSVEAQRYIFVSLVKL